MVANLILVSLIVVESCVDQKSVYGEIIYSCFDCGSCYRRKTPSVLQEAVQTHHSLSLYTYTFQEFVGFTNFLISCVVVLKQVIMIELSSRWQQQECCCVVQLQPNFCTHSHTNYNSCQCYMIFLFNGSCIRPVFVHISLQAVKKKAW